MGLKEDKRKIYKANGAIRLTECNDLEVFVLETAGVFDHGDHAKITFDNSEGIFALLAILKTVANHYKHAFVEEFFFKKKNLSSISCGLVVSNRSNFLFY